MRASGGRGSTILGRLHSPRRIKMTQPERSALTSAALDHDTTNIGTLELSEKKWVLAVQFPGVKRHTRHVLGASGEELATCQSPEWFGRSLQICRRRIGCKS